MGVTMSLSPLSLITLAFLPVLCQAACDPGWIEAGGTLGCIKFESMARSWFDAASYCHEINITAPASGTAPSVSLAEAATAEDLALLQSFLRIIASVGTAGDWWLSGHDLHTEGTWKFLSGTEVPAASFLTGSALPASNNFNCMSLGNDLDFLGMAQNCSTTLSSICQYTPASGH